jgi:hypothetical protein
MSGIEDMGPINELRMVTRWKLGRAGSDGTGRPGWSPRPDAERR